MYREWAAEQHEVTGSVHPADAEGATAYLAGYEADLDLDLDQRITRALEAAGIPLPTGALSSERRADPVSTAVVRHGDATYTFDDAEPLHNFTEVFIDHLDGVGPRGPVWFGSILNRAYDPDAIIDAFAAAGHRLTEAPPSAYEM